MFLHRSLGEIGFTTDEVGIAFAEASDKQQREILLAMASRVEVMNTENDSDAWGRQCSAIANQHREDSLSSSERQDIANMLRVLLEHITEESVSR